MGLCSKKFGFYLIESNFLKPACHIDVHVEKVVTEEQRAERLAGDRLKDRSRQWQEKGKD